MLHIVKTAVAFFLFGSLATLMLAFALANRHPVSFDLSPLSYVGSAPLFLLAFVAFFLGLLVASLMAFFSAVALRFRLRQQEKRIAAQQNEIEALRLEASQRAAPPPLSSISGGV